MKFKVLLFVATLFVLSCQNSPKSSTEQTENQTDTLKQEILANTQKIEISIEGMTCTGCENTIQNKINEFDGVYSVKASHEQGLAVVEIDTTKADILKIEEAINQVGYKATGHKKVTE